MLNMKRRAKLSFDASAFSLITTVELRQIWDRTYPALRDLHRCSPFCKLDSATFHSDACQYVANVDYEQAIECASQFVIAQEGRRIDGPSLLISEVDPTAQPGTGQAELTLSFLTDPIEIKNSVIFNNGRHRATAVLDSGSLGLVPVVRL